MRKGSTLVVTALVALVAASVAVAAPPTLTDETLLACTTNLGIGGVGGCTTLAKGSMSSQRNCPLAAPDVPGPGTFTFEATGPAAGAYPGTFEESGSVRLGGFDTSMGLQPVLEFSSSFTIDSPIGHVEGSKRLRVSSGGLCYTTPPFLAGVAFLEASYDALITTAAGTFRDEGTATTTVFDTVQGNTTNPQTIAGFGELFASTLTETLPVLPSTKEQCKNGGWQTYGIFKNQGECVRTFGGN
jgi:hypothetical protein